MRTANRPLVVAAACCLASPALAATQGPIAVTVVPGNQYVNFQGFDPALGQLRCVRVGMGVTWSAAGEMELQNQTAGAVTATMCVGASCGIGHFDGTGYVSHAGAGSCSEVVGVCSAPQFQYCVYPFSRAGGTSATGLVTHPGYLHTYVGAGLRGLAGGYSQIEQFVSSSPGCGVGLTIDSFSATAGFTLQYVYTPIHHCPGDVNGDGVVDFVDLNGVLGSYGESGPCAQGDVNNDNVVDFLDLNESLSYYGLACAADAPAPAHPLPPRLKNGAE